MEHAINTRLDLGFRAGHAPCSGPIRFAIGKCAEGKVLVARSQAGVCAILLDDDAEGLRRQLRATFPSHSIEESAHGLESELAAIVTFIDGGQATGVVHLDVGGSPFQQRVWKALCGIPAGEVRTYAQVADKIGAPGAARAVAGACAANLLAVAIPCHRVIRSDSSLSGYRWGAERKRALLAREQA